MGVFYFPNRVTILLIGFSTLYDKSSYWKYSNNTTLGTGNNMFNVVKP